VTPRANWPSVHHASTGFRRGCSRKPARAAPQGTPFHFSACHSSGTPDGQHGPPHPSAPLWHQHLRSHRVVQDQCSGRVRKTGQPTSAPDSVPAPTSTPPKALPFPRRTPGPTRGSSAVGWARRAHRHRRPARVGSWVEKENCWRAHPHQARPQRHSVSISTRPKLWSFIVAGRNRVIRAPTRQRAAPARNFAHSNQHRPSHVLRRA